MDNKFFIKQKEELIKNLDNKKKLYEEEKKKIEKRLNNNIESEKKIKFENSILKEEYDNLKKMLKERGLIFEIFNNHYDIKEWDNLFFKKEDGHYIITTKKGECVKVFNEEVSAIIEESINELKAYSMVVIRVTTKNIRIQLHRSDKK